jgi:hypothetical protein
VPGKRTPISFSNALALAFLTVAILATLYVATVYAVAGYWFLPYGVR